MTKELIVGGDFGGTNARLKTFSNGAFIDAHTFPRANYDGPADVLREYQKMTGGKITVASIAIAGLVVPGVDIIQMSNGWTFSTKSLTEEFGKVKIMNDFAPVSLAVKEAVEHPENVEVVQMGGGKPMSGNVGIIGPGTGLGSGMLRLVDGKLHDDETEVCAQTIAFYDPNDHIPTEEKRTLARNYPTLREDMMLRIIAEKHEARSHGHVSIERICCGPGLQDLHDALAILDGHNDLVGARTPASISAAALGKTPDPIAREALDRMMTYLGREMGDIVSYEKATGGIYIASHIVNKINAADPTYLAQSPLRRAFESKGRIGDFMRSAPIFVLKEAEPAFTGLRIDLQQTLSR